MKIPAGRRIEVPAGVVLHRTRLSLVAASDFPPRTVVVDTVLDLADDCRRDAEVIAVVTRALQRRDVTRHSLLNALRGRRRARWRALLKDLLGDTAAGVESVLEWRFAKDVIRAHALPTPVRQHVLRLEHESQRRDGLFEEYGVVVELDGRLGHTGEGAFRDMRRDNAAIRRGEVVLRYGWADVVGRPCEAATETAAVLRQRGWVGRLRRCSPACTAR